MSSSCQILFIIYNWRDKFGCSTHVVSFWLNGEMTTAERHFERLLGLVQNSLHKNRPKMQLSAIKSTLKSYKWTFCCILSPIVFWDQTLDIAIPSSESYYSKVGMYETNKWVWCEHLKCLCSTEVTAYKYVQRYSARST